MAAREPNDEPDRDVASPVTRWWLNTALARFVAGKTGYAQTRVDSGFVSPFEALRPGEPSLDLDDPDQRDLGDYELRELIGRGGMGVVYRAHQHSLDREVAVKLLYSGIWASPESVAALRKEAQHAARLQHPNIVTVYEIGEHEGQVFYVMPLIEGRSLAERIEQDGLPSPRESAALLRTVAEAVDYAHRLGVLHLDLKPANVMIEVGGAPKVTDFGLARRLDRGEGRDVHRVAGTPGYMAPEQLQAGLPLNAATDVWGLGATLYEALTGHPPFQGRSEQAVAEPELHDQVGRARRLDRKLPRDLESICLHCLAGPTEQRYPSARALADDLGRYLEGRVVSVRSLNRLQRAWRWARREPKFATAAAAAVLALAVGLVTAGVLWQRAESQRQQSQRNLWAQRHETAWRLFEGNRGFHALSALATNLKEQEVSGDSDAAERERLRVGLALAQMPALLDVIAVDAPIDSLAISPDGRWVALGLHPDQAALYEVASGRQRWRVKLEFADSMGMDGQVRRVQFTPDGRHVLVTRHWLIMHVRPGGRRMLRLSVADGAQTRPPFAENALGQTWSEDGRHVLLHDEVNAKTQLYDARTWQAVGPSTPHSETTSWLIAPRLGYLAAWHKGRPSVQVLDPQSMSVRHELRTEDRFMAWAASPDGRWLALGRLDGEVTLVDTDTGRQRPLTSRPQATVNWLRFSADGQRLSASSQDGSLHVWSVPEGALQGRVLRFDDELWGHQLEHDGVVATLLAMHWDHVSLWQLTGAGDQAGAPVLLAPDITHPGYVARFASAIDPGHALLVTGGQEGGLRLWRLPPSPVLGSFGPTQREPGLRYDGQHLLAVEGRKLWVFGVDDERPRSPVIELPQPPGFAVLAPDGRTLVASSGRRLHVIDWRTGRQRYPPIVLGGMPTRLLLSPDGRNVLTAWGAQMPTRRGHYAESLRAHALSDGRPLGPVAVVLEKDMSPDWLFAPDGTHVLLGGESGVTLRPLSNLSHVLRRFGTANAAGDRTEFVAVDAVRDELVLVRRSGSGEWSGQGEWLERWSLRDGRRRQLTPLEAKTRHVALREQDGLVALNATPSRGNAFQSMALSVDRAGRSRVLTSTRREQFARTQAFSPDGRILAQALRDGVLLHDADTGTPLAPPLRMALPQPDVIAQLAFSPDGRQLLARSYLGRWLRWNLLPDRRPVDQIVAEAQLLGPAPGDPFRPLAADLRTAFRARDPGVRMNLPRNASVWSCLPTPGQLPPREPGTPPALLDLSGHYRVSLHDASGPASSHCGLPLGVQRLLGIDYDIRGILTLGPTALDPKHAALPTRLRIASLPPGRVAAVHLLAPSTLRAPGVQAGAPVAVMTLHYRTGPPHTLPIRHAKDLAFEVVHPTDLEKWPLGAATRLAWRGQPATWDSRWVGAYQHLYELRLPNPEPQRELSALEVRLLKPMVGGLNIVAITLEPAATVAPSDVSTQLELATTTQATR